MPTRHWIAKNDGLVHRWIQRAGKSDPLSYRNGFCLRLPFDKIWLVIFR